MTCKMQYIKSNSLRPNSSRTNFQIVGEPEHVVGEYDLAVLGRLTLEGDGDLSHQRSVVLQLSLVPPVAVRRVDWSTKMISK